MTETPSFHHNPYDDEPVREVLTLEECLKKLEYEGVRVEVSPADPEYLARLGLDDLPKGMAVFGGAARATLLYSRYGEEIPVRDIDLMA